MNITVWIFYILIMFSNYKYLSNYEAGRFISVKKISYAHLEAFSNWFP